MQLCQFTNVEIGYKMAASPCMIKTFKNLLWNRKADDLKTWYSAPSTAKFVQMMPLFYGKVKCDPLYLCMGKIKTIDFSETIVVYDTKVGRCSQLTEYMKL